MSAANQQYIRDRIAIEDCGFLSPCWVWQKCTTGGYGQARLPGTDRPYRTHRISYEAFVGPIPVGKCLDHLCNNKGCCNPDHLEPVTIAENTRRAGGLFHRKRATHAKPPVQVPAHPPRDEELELLGTALLQIKNDRRLRLVDMARIIGRSDDRIAAYISGEAEMGFVTFRRAVAAWPELAGKLNMQDLKA
jgi:hypothetical protein